MRETEALIERVRRVSRDLQHIDIAVDAALAHLEPGQTISARPLKQTGWEPYLRAHWIPVDILPGRVVVEIPTGPDFAPGTMLSILSPVGRPIPFRSGLLHMLLIADDMLPTPFIHAARNLTGGGVEVTLLLHGAARDYPLELLPPEVEVLHGDESWSWPEQVETLNWADQVLALAPLQTQIATYHKLYDTIAQLRSHKIPDGFVCGMFFHRLACGAGACGACMIPSGRDLLTCVDGPAIDLKRVKLS